MKTKTMLTLAVPVLGVIIAALLAGSFPITSVHSTYKSLSFDELTQAGDAIVVGKVKEVKPSYTVYVNGDPRVELVLTDVVLSVEKELTGNYNNKEITVTLPGGVIEKLVNGKMEKHQSSGEDDGDDLLIPNKRLLLVLEKGFEGGPYEGKYLVAGGMHQGKFDLKDGKGYSEKYLPNGEAEDALSQKIIKSRAQYSSPQFFILNLGKPLF